MTAHATGEVIGGRYKVLKRLGKGGFGEVFLVEHMHLAGELFALKVLRCDPSDGQQRARFEREARVALKLVHPSIVTIREFSVVGDLVCYAMDYVDGPTLAKVLEESGPLPVERAVARTREALEALAVAHEAGIVHRDMKPDNVILAHAGTPEERSRVLDFGIAKVITEKSAGLTQGGFVGTAAYMAPEQAEGKEGKVDARSDLYSVGCMLYELLAGRPPFQSETLVGYVVQHQIEPPPPFAETAAGRAIPAALEAVVRKALAKKPGDRFASAREMIAALDEAIAPECPDRDRKGPLRTAGELDWAAPLEGQTVEHYRILRKLGEGGFGVVCVAEDLMLGREVALKLLRPDLALDPSFLERFAREGRIAASLAHPGIVTVHAAGAVGRTCYLAMELLEGETLAHRLARAGALPAAALVPLLRPVFAAVESAHERGIVHRDLKPDNIFILRDGRAKVLDFGIAAITRGEGGPRLTAQGEVLGTLAYLSPEQARGEPVDGRSDVYALGAIVFEALTGRPPFLHEDARAMLLAHVVEPPPRLADVRPDLAAAGAFGERLEGVVARALAKRKEERWGRAAALGAALEEALVAAPFSQAAFAGGAAPSRAAGERPPFSGRGAGEATAGRWAATGDHAAAPAAAVHGEESVSSHRTVLRPPPGGPLPPLAEPPSFPPGGAPAPVPGAGAPPPSGAPLPGTGARPPSGTPPRTGTVILPGPTAASLAPGGGPIRPSGELAVPGAAAPGGIEGTAPGAQALAVAGASGPAAVPRPLVEPPWRVPERARVSLPGGRTLFLFATPALPFGRSKPGTEGCAARNEIVLRVLPCRSEALDRENFQATRRISSNHGEFRAQDRWIWLVDRSTHGTAIDGVRLPRETPVRVPARFRLDVAGVLPIDAEVVGEDPVAGGGGAAALVLRRIGNFERHVYAWVLGAANVEGVEVVNEAGTLTGPGGGPRGLAARPEDTCAV